MATNRSPARERAEKYKDDHEETYRQNLKKQGGGLLGRAKEYDFTEDVVVPRGDPRHIKRQLPQIDQHRAENQPSGVAPDLQKVLGVKWLRSGK